MAQWWNARLGYRWPRFHPQHSKERKSPVGGLFVIEGEAQDSV